MCADVRHVLPLAVVAHNLAGLNLDRCAESLERATNVLHAVVMCVGARHARTERHLTCHVGVRAIAAERQTAGADRRLTAFADRPLR